MANDLAGLFGFTYDDPQPPPAPPAPEPQPEPEPALAAPGGPPPAAPVPPPPPAPIADLVAAGAGQIGRPEQMITAIRHAATQARGSLRQARKHDGGLINGLEHWQPDSVAGLIRYRDGRGWVPPGHEGGVAEQAGVKYQTWVAIPLSIPLLACLWIIQRPFRAGVAFALTTLILATTVIVLARYGVL